MTRAAFQAIASLNQQATDPKSHTLVRITYILSSPVLSPANSDGRPYLALSAQDLADPDAETPAVSCTGRRFWLAEFWELPLLHREICRGAA